MADWIQRLDRMIAISVDDAQEIVGVIDVLEALAKPRGMTLSQAVRGIRSQLASMSTDAPAHVHASMSGPDGLSALTTHYDEFIPTEAAAELLGITPGGVRYLARNGRIGARRSGGRWFISSADAHELLDARRAG